VIVLKSPRGICLQLESGKVIAIRASGAKGGDSVLTGGNKPVGSSEDVIDMTNDEDDLDNALFKTNAVAKESLPPPPPIEQKIPKPNIVPRKVKNPSEGANSNVWNSQNSSSSSKDASTLNNYSASSKPTQGYRKILFIFLLTSF
jgi:hypothetical protein